MFGVPVAVAELDVVDAVLEETEDCTTDDVDDVPDEIEVSDVEAVVEMTVPFLMYAESLLPAPITQIKKPYGSRKGGNLPQNSELFAAQAMLQSVSAWSALVLPRAFPQ